MKKILDILFYLFSAGCIISCCFLFYRSRITELETEWKMGEEIEKTGTRIEDMSEERGLDDILSEQEENLARMESEIQEMQKKYELISFLEEKENGVAREICPETMYDKYLGIEQGELARIQGIEDVEACGAEGMLNSHFSGLTFPIGEEIWVQYGNRNYIEEHLTAGRLIIDNPELDFGYMGARAGMDFEEIQTYIGECEIQEGFMYTDDYKMYHVEFDDEYYHYVYISEDPEGKGYSWLTID